GVGDGIGGGGDVGMDGGVGDGISGGGDVDVGMGGG
ncbi:hypothetical protein Tco_0787083, partial [Tanacetum coccineum]